MHKNQGFITIMSLLAMGIMLTFSLFLIYMSNMEYIIISSSKDNIQAYYSAESKIYMVLDMDEYYDLLLAKVKQYLRTGRIANYEDRIIEIEDEHLLEGDKNNKLSLEFDIEDNRRILELSTSGSCNKITNHLMAKIYLLNDFYEMGIPIISEDSIDEERLDEYIDYIDDMEDKIGVPTEEAKVIGIDGSKYEKINIITKINGEKHVEFFRNDIGTPRKTINIEKGKNIFLVAKDVCILAEEGLDKVNLNGSFYIEGNLQIATNAEVDGILIINNGNLVIEPPVELKWNGLVLLKDCMGEGFQENNVEVNYDEKTIKPCGVDLPGFIDLKIKLIKRK